MEPLLDAAFLRRLERLKLVFQQRYHGRPMGSQLRSRSGMSLEFAEYREYHPGDDFRYVDWNLYGRLDRLFVKVFTREEDAPVYLFVDVSRSMEIGGKLAYAIKLTAALAYLALNNMNRVGLFPFASRLQGGVPPRGGPRQVFEIFRFLRRLAPAGETSINESLGDFYQRSHEGGLAILISDMLSAEGYQEGLARMRWHRFQPVVLQLLAPDDLMPSPAGEVRLLDVEAAREWPAYLSAATLDSYRARLKAYRQGLERFCRQRGIDYFLISSGEPLERTLFETLRRGVFLK